VLVAGVPDLGSGVVQRSRIDQLFELAGKIAVVTAPAGSGKTVACADWIASSGLRARWLMLDEQDNDPAFLRARLAAIPPSPDVLVFDDLHLLTDRGALRELDRVIAHAPPSQRIILSGRYLPGLRLAKLRVAGEVTDLGAAELACTEDEADAIFGFSVAERDELLGYTQGWITGLRLAALASAGVGVGAQPLAADYLRDEVLDAQPPDVRLFMLRTSVAERLTAGLADSLTGGQLNGAATFEALASQNCFVNRLGGGEYRYYPVLRDMLMAELARQCQEEVPPRASSQPVLAKPRAPLSPSELAVLRLLPSFLTNQEIADALFLSVNTVKTHLRSIYRKLAATSRRDAIANGRRLRLL
jgi:LuxR family transcriptional regulator, maltose regulon positive regulatory protein